MTRRALLQAVLPCYLRAARRVTGTDRRSPSTAPRPTFHHDLCVYDHRQGPAGPAGLLRHGRDGGGRARAASRWKPGPARTRHPGEPSKSLPKVGCVENRPLLVNNYLPARNKSTITTTIRMTSTAAMPMYMTEQFAGRIVRVTRMSGPEGIRGAAHTRTITGGTAACVASTLRLNARFDQTRNPPWVGVSPNTSPRRPLDAK
jgi:hypothetical protein